MDEYAEALGTGIKDAVHSGPIGDRRPDTRRVTVETKATGDREFPYETIIDDPNTGKTYAIGHRILFEALQGHERTLYAIRGGALRFSEPRRGLRPVVDAQRTRKPLPLGRG